MIRTYNIIPTQVPNPNALKFEVEGVLLTKEAHIFRNTEEAAAGSPMADLLFRMDYVETVFISANFITVLRKPAGPPWESVLGELRILIKRHLEAGQPILSSPQGSSIEDKSPSNEVEEKIVAIMENQIREATNQDGGDITFESFKNGVVKVKLAGSCTGCPFAPRTIKSGIEVLLKRNIPEVISVTSEDVQWPEEES